MIILKNKICQLQSSSILGSFSAQTTGTNLTCPPKFVKMVKQELEIHQTRCLPYMQLIQVCFPKFQMASRGITT